MINLVRFMLNLIILRGEVGSEYATLPQDESRSGSIAVASWDAIQLL